MATTTNPMKTGQESQTRGQGHGQGLGDRAKEGVGGTAGQSHETGQGFMDKAKDVAGGAVDKAKDVASAIGRTAEDATHGVGCGMQSLAGTMRENLPREGVLGS